MDIRTLLLLSALLSGMHAVVAGLLCRNTKLPGVSAWCAGAVFLSVGIGLAAARGYLTDFMSIVVANGLILLGYAVTWDGMRRFVGRGFSYVVLLLSIVLVSGGIYSFYYHSTVNISLSFRILTVSAFVMFFNAAIANTLFVEKLGRLAVTVVGAAFAFNGIIWIIRVLKLVIDSAMNDFMLSGTTTVVFLYCYMFFVCVFAIGEIWMVKEEMDALGKRTSITQLLLGR